VRADVTNRRTTCVYSSRAVQQVGRAKEKAMDRTSTEEHVTATRGAEPRMDPLVVLYVAGCLLYAGALFLGLALLFWMA
jgi:hypothetical protein